MLILRWSINFNNSVFCPCSLVGWPVLHSSDRDGHTNQRKRKTTKPEIKTNAKLDKAKCFEDTFVWCYDHFTHRLLFFSCLSSRAYFFRMDCSGVVVNSKFACNNLWFLSSKIVVKWQNGLAVGKIRTKILHSVHCVT